MRGGKGAQGSTGLAATWTKVQIPAAHTLAVGPLWASSAVSSPIRCGRVLGTGADEGLVQAAHTGG